MEALLTLNQFVDSFEVKNIGERCAQQVIFLPVLESFHEIYTFYARKNIGGYHNKKATHQEWMVVLQDFMITEMEGWLEYTV